MRILVDENVPYGREAFGTLGEVVTAHGRAVCRDMLADVDALVVRSITKVNADLLDGTPVRFVGTCTIGEDHVDKAWLAANGVAFSSAPGCNANSVGDYITAALLTLEQRLGLDLSSMSLGVVGVGNVGSKVAAKASALGMTCVLNDPPRQEREGGDTFRPLSDILACDIITFHVPLEKAGPHPTYHLCDKRLLSAMKPGVIVFNSSRGPVVDNAALKTALAQGHVRATVLDVWEGEPAPDLELVAAAAIATPHIAGYSFDGKVNGTRQIYEALCRARGILPEWDPAPLLPPPDCPELTVDPRVPGALFGAVNTVYDISADDARMRGILGQEGREAQAAWFDRLRKEYPRRREFFNTQVRMTAPDAGLAAKLAGIGFGLAGPEA